MNPVMKMIACTLAMTGLAGAAYAQEVVGYVKTVTGEATITTAGKVVKAAPSTPVHLGSSLKTGPRSSMGVTYKDGQINSFGPDTELTVDEYLYAPAKGDLKFAASMNKGTINVVSGTIAKLKPESVSYKTPTGTIGVRGTNFVVKVEPQ